MEAIMPVRHSGLQRDVLKLFRDLHRAARKKDPDNSSKLTEFGEFVKKYSSSQDMTGISSVSYLATVLRELSYV